MVSLVPRDNKFFHMFADLSAEITEGARVLTELLKDYRDVSARVARIKQHEHTADELTHAILTRLNQTFITPFDREDVHRLASSLDDVLDFVNAAGDRLVMYNIKQVPPDAAELSQIIVRQTEELGKAVSKLEKHQGVLEHCVEINALENEADRVTRKAIAYLFEHEKDPIQLIKIKELYETLEIATDKAEDAANVLEAVVLKSA